MVWRALSQTLGPPESLNNTYLMDCGFLDGSGRLFVSLWGPQSINGPSVNVRSTRSLDGSQWVCMALCESAGLSKTRMALNWSVGPSVFMRALYEPCKFPVGLWTLSYSAGPSVNLYGFQSVCGPSVCLLGIRERTSKWLSMSM